MQLLQLGGPLEPYQTGLREAEGGQAQLEHLREPLEAGQGDFWSPGNPGAAARVGCGGVWWRCDVDFGHLHKKWQDPM